MRLLSLAGVPAAVAANAVLGVPGSGSAPCRDAALIRALEAAIEAPRALAGQMGSSSANIDASLDALIASRHPAVKDQVAGRLVVASGTVLTGYPKYYSLSTISPGVLADPRGPAPRATRALPQLLDRYYTPSGIVGGRKGASSGGNAHRSGHTYGPSWGSDSSDSSDDSTDHGHSSLPPPCSRYGPSRGRAPPPVPSYGQDLWAWARPSHATRHDRARSRSRSPSTMRRVQRSLRGGDGGVRIGRHLSRHRRSWESDSDSSDSDDSRRH